MSCPPAGLNNLLSTFDIAPAGPALGPPPEGTNPPDSWSDTWITSSIVVPIAIGHMGDLVIQFQHDDVDDLDNLRFGDYETPIPTLIDGPAIDWLVFSGHFGGPVIGNALDGATVTPSTQEGSFPCKLAPCCYRWGVNYPHGAGIYNLALVSSIVSTDAFGSDRNTLTTTHCTVWETWTEGGGSGEPTLEQCPPVPRPPWPYGGLVTVEYRADGTRRMRRRVSGGRGGPIDLTS